MSHAVDRTLIDLDRRSINLSEYTTEEALSQFIVENYPNFVTFLKKYFEFEETEDSPTHLIKELFYTRDISQTDISLLNYIEDEYLLGQSYFQGFTDKRAAAKYSNTLYRSKGTKYSIQQFFRTFFNIDPDVVYGKTLVLRVGEDNIGAESQRYLTNDKLYQQFALLIKTELSTDKWREPYKLFVHPAGMFVAGEVQIVGAVDLDIETQPDPGLIDVPPFVIESFATLDGRAVTSATGLFDFNLPDGSMKKFRTTLGSGSVTYPTNIGNDLEDVGDLTLESVGNLYTSIAEMIEVDAPTFDEDVDSNAPLFSNSGFDLSSTETIDQDKFDWVDSSDNITNLDELL